MGASDLHVTVDSAKLRCVLDPGLALGHVHGPRLALGLTRMFEIWLTRSFWQVLDASELLGQAHLSPAPRTAFDPSAISEWIALRDRTDAGSWLLRWVGDNVAESQLHVLDGDGLVDRFERLSAALATRDEGPPGGQACWQPAFDPHAVALDAIALSATLEGALILCPQPPQPADPWPVQVLERLRLPVRRIAQDEARTLFVAERELIRQQLASAGLAALLEPMAPLAVVHVLAGHSAFSPDGEGADPWSQAQAWWYPL